MLFNGSEGLPITEYLPEDHEGRDIYSVVGDPHPDKGRAIARVEESQGRRVSKTGPAHESGPAPVRLPEGGGSEV